MRAEAIIEYGQPLQSTDLPSRAPEGTEVLIRTHHCGVCHSDVHLHDGYFALAGGNKLDIRGGRKLPFALGHEIEGEVAAVGPDVTGISPGQRFVIYPWIGCGQCSTCARGDEHLCAKPRQLGIQVHGGFATEVMVPHPRYLIDFGTTDPALASTYMCSGITAFSALKKIGPAGAGDPIAIVGLGGVGMMGVQFARALYPEAPLHVADIDAAKREAALGLGATAAYDPRDAGAVKALLGATGGGAHGAIDFVGAESSLAFANGALRKGGKAVIVGLFGGGFQMPIAMWPLRAISLIGSFVGRLDETKEMMALVRAGKIAPIPVTERPLAAASQSLDDLREGRVIGRVVLKAPAA